MFAGHLAISVSPPLTGAAVLVAGGQKTTCCISGAPAPVPGRPTTTKAQGGENPKEQKIGSPGGFAGRKNTQSTKKVLGVSRLHPHPPEARTHDLLVCWTASRPLGQGHHVYFSFLCFFVLFVVCFLCFVFLSVLSVFLGSLCLLCRLCCLLWLFWLFYLSSLFRLVCPLGDSK